MHPILADRQRLRLHLIAWGLVGALLGLLVQRGSDVDPVQAVAA